MKVGLLTIHNAFNYGAALQAYATCRVISNLGHQVDLIDYKNKSLIEKRKVFLPSKSLLDIFRNIRTLLNLRKVYSRIEKFKKFHRLTTLSKFQYTKQSEWDVSEYDIILTGSDQTFSLYLTDNPEDMKPYFLQQVSGVKKGCFASSMGEKTERFSQKDLNWMRDAFKGFHSLAVRDNKTADIIQSLTGNRPLVVLDPTLLLSNEEWDNVVQPSKYSGEEYIAFYTVLSDKWVIEYVKKLAIQTGLKVIALHKKSRFEIGCNFIYADDSGPGEFLHIIKHAKLVITTSFHATVFSIIYKKNFITLVLGEGNRLSSLLDSLNLNNRSVRENESNNLKLATSAINFQSVDVRLKGMQLDSMIYLENITSKS